MEKPLPPSRSPLPYAATADGYIISVLICGGLFTWEVIQSLPIDWKVVMGRKGCRWGAVLLYFPLRTTALAYFACSIALLFPPPWGPTDPVDVRYAKQSTAIISGTFAYHIMLLRTASLWHFWIVTWLLSALVVLIWGFDVFCISRMQSPWFSNTMPRMLAVILLCVATLLLILFISGLIRMRLKCRSASICRPVSAHYVTASLWCTMWKEKAYLVLMIWMAQIVGSATAWSTLDPVTWSIIELICFTVVIICGSRMYQHCAHTSNCCSTLTCLISSAVRAGVYRSRRSAFGAETFVTNASRISENLPALRVITRDLQRRREPIEMTTLKTDNDSASPTSPSPKMMVAQAFIHSEPSSSVAMSPPDTTFLSRTFKVSGWMESTLPGRNTREEQGAG